MMDENDLESMRVDEDFFNLGDEDVEQNRGNGRRRRNTEELETTPPKAKKYTPKPKTFQEEWLTQAEFKGWSMETHVLLSAMLVDPRW